MFRRSLLTKLLALTLAAIVTSTVAAASLTIHMTAIAIHQAEGDSLADEADAYEQLLGYAATHRSWQGVDDLVQRLGTADHLDITLTALTGHRIATSADGSASALRPLATVDALAVDTTFHTGRPPTPEAPTTASSARPCPPTGTCAGPTLHHYDDPETIDPRVVGPYALAPAEKILLRRYAEESVECYRTNLAVPADVTVLASGRPVVVLPDGVAASADCASSALATATTTESRALSALTSLVRTCLQSTGQPPVTVVLGWRWYASTASTPPTSVADSCITRARAKQLAPYVAPAVQLSVSGAAPPSTFVDLSSGNRLRIAAVAAGVIAVMMVLTAWAARRIVRPLRALDGAAHELAAGNPAREIAVRGRDEISRLTASFNDMSAQLARADRLRRNQVNDVAHELRNPVTTIRSSLEAAQDEIVATDDEFLASLLDETLHLQHLIEDLQDLAAADAGELKVHLEPVRVEQVLDQVGGAFRAAAQAGEVSLSVVADPAVTVLADATRLRQVVGNLVSNAVRHAPPRTTVSISAIPTDETVEIVVADGGPGISAADLPHVFERFWRSDSSRSRETGGSGLGLAIARRLARAHGGDLRVESRPGFGTTFTLVMPIDVPPERR